MTSTQQHAQPWTEPPWSGWIETTGDALLILEAARRGLIPRVTRRLVDAERKMITSGSVFVFDEDESGIKRWTDGFFWSPSRILGNFLLYRETDKRGAGHRTHRNDPEGHDFHSDPAKSEPLSRPRDAPSPTIDKHRERSLLGSLTNSYKFKTDGLMKKTFSLSINGVAQHLISYYKIEDVESGRLRCPSSFPELACLDISPEYLDKTHFRNPPKVEIGADGIPRYRGEADDIDTTASTSPTASLLSPIPGGPSSSPTTPFATGPPILTERPLASSRRVRPGPYTSPPPGKRVKPTRPSKQSQSQNQTAQDANSPTSTSPISPEDTSSPLSPQIPSLPGPSSSSSQAPGPHAQPTYDTTAHAPAIPTHHYPSYPGVPGFYQPYPPVYAHHPPPPQHQHQQVAYAHHPQPPGSQAGTGSEDASSPRQGATTTTSGVASDATTATAGSTTSGGGTGSSTATTSSATTSATAPSSTSATTTTAPPVAYPYSGYAPHCSDPSQAAAAAPLPPPPPPGGGYYTYYAHPPPPTGHHPHAHAHMGMAPPPVHSTSTHGHSMIQNTPMTHTQHISTHPSSAVSRSAPTTPTTAAPGPPQPATPAYQAYPPVSHWGAYPGYVPHHPHVAPHTHTMAHAPLGPPPPPHHPHPHAALTHPHAHAPPPPMHMAPPPHGMTGYNAYHHPPPPPPSHHPHAHHQYPAPHHQQYAHPGIPGVAGAGAPPAPPGTGNNSGGPPQGQTQSPGDEGDDSGDD